MRISKFRELMPFRYDEDFGKFVTGFLDLSGIKNISDSVGELDLAEGLRE